MKSQACCMVAMLLVGAFFPKNMLDFPTPKLFNAQYQDLKLEPLKFVPASASIKSTCEYLQKFCHIGISSHSDPAQPSAIVTFIDIVRYVIPRFKQHKNDCMMDPIEYVLTLNPADESYLVWQVGAQDVLKDV